MSPEIGRVKFYEPTLNGKWPMGDCFNKDKIESEPSASILASTEILRKGLKKQMQESEEKLKGVSKVKAVVIESIGAFLHT